MSPTRRRLLKGAMFVPPVVLTLRSGAVAAASSTSSCLIADQSAAQDADALASERDAWLRSDVDVRQARRIRKKKGKWVLKTNRAIALYTHQPKGTYSWWSVKGKRGRRRWKYQDSGKTIDVYDRSGQVLLFSGGILMIRNGVNRRRYVGLPEDVPMLGLVELDEMGNIKKDEEGMPVVGKVEEAGGVGSIHATASCWASLHPNVVV
jgi:hypothetical protein